MYNYEEDAYLIDLYLTNYNEWYYIFSEDITT
jgi:hypothetical protein